MSQIEDTTDSNPNVLAYRMAQVEASVNKLDKKFDQILSAYPTSEMVRLTISPILSDIAELKQKHDKQLEDHRQDRQQVKMAILTAVVFPIIVGIILAATIGVIPS